MVAKEYGPLAPIRDVRRLIEDVDNREAVFHLDGHEDARHEREMEGHVAFVAITEIGGSVFRPLIRLRKQHAVFIGAVHMGPQIFEEGMGLGKVFTIGPLPLEQIGNGVEPDTVNPHTHPEINNPQHFGLHLRVVEIEIRLM